MNRRQLAVSSLATGVALIGGQRFSRGASAKSSALKITLQAYPLAVEALTGAVLAGARRVLLDRFEAAKAKGLRIDVYDDGKITISASSIDATQEEIASLVRRNFVEIIDPKGIYLTAGALVSTSLSGP